MIWANMKELILPQASDTTAWLFAGSLWAVAAVYLALANLIAFAAMWIDKRRSKREGMRRIPEKTLFLAAILGGSIGAIAGMQLFRHKTKHWYFVWGMPAILLAQIALAVWLLIG